MSAATLPERQYLLLHDVDWDDFRSFERMVDDQPGHRLTYDRGRLEYMTLSHLHEFAKMVMHGLFAVLTEEFDVPRKSGGSTTFRREDLDRGFEPDQCYYVENEPQVRGKDELDLTVDPPPDVLIEIEITRSALDRLGIFAAMGIPEVWCTDGEQLRFLQLADSGEYEEQPQRRHFPSIRGSDIASFLQKRKQLDERTLLKSFREWVRDVRDSNQEN
ncbi:MAG: Uma2 family endonuclease [Planctomycetaceae bacterium]